MKVPFAVFVNAKDLDASAFAGATRAELVESLLAWFDVRENSKIIDEEILVDAGILVGSAGYTDIDEEALRWRAQSPTAVRHEIVADFLWGYWRPVKRASQVVVRMLLDSIGTYPADSWAHAATLLALYTVLVSRDIRLPPQLAFEVRKTLLEQLDQLDAADLHPGITAFLRRLQ